MRWAKSRPGQPLIFVSIKPSPAREHVTNTIRFANAHIEKACSELSFFHYVDVFSSMMNEHGQPAPQYFKEDLLHMNRKGFELWISKLRPILQDLSVVS